MIAVYASTCELSEKRKLLYNSGSASVKSSVRISQSALNLFLSGRSPDLLATHNKLT